MKSLKENILDAVVQSDAFYQIAVNKNADFMQNFIQDIELNISVITDKIDKVNDELVDSF